jgi:hypothetical protein
MHMEHRALILAVWGLPVASCGGTTGPNTPLAAGSGELTVTSDVPISGSVTGASYTRGGGFTTAQPSCVSQTIGACSINPCFVGDLITSGDAPLISAGQVSIVGAEMNADGLEPQSNNSYASEVAEGLPWTTGGETVTFKWAHFPGESAEAGGEFAVTTPPYIALLAGSSFADRTDTLVRTRDLTISWSNDSPPGAFVLVNVNLWSGSTRVNCGFSATSGVGVVPSAALQFLAPGQGTYDVHSKQGASETLTGADGAPFVLKFNVDADARTSYGLANGPVTIE